MSGTLLSLAAIFGQLALLAIGGVNAVLPEMHRQVVDVHHWMSGREFTALYALAQAAPGPNMLVVTLVGWRVAGLAGAAVATGALVAPACLLTFGVALAWSRFRTAGWRIAAQAGLTPVTVGLVLAAALMLSRNTVRGPASAALLLASTALLLATRLHPLWLLGAGVLLGVSGLV